MSINTKRILCAFLMILSALALTACGETNRVSMERAKRAEATGPSWTVLVYMCGGELESVNGMASECLKDLMNVEYPENINIVVETGGSSQWHINGIYPDYLQRFEMQKSGMCLVDQKMTDNMGDYRTLQDFLSWGTNTYPADHYMAIIWDHGGSSMTGLAYDELHGDDCLNLEELSYAVSLSGTIFDIIGFDAGLSANLEIAAAIAPYGDYMIASEEYAPSCWDYKAMAECLIKYPNGVIGDICRVICDATYKKCENDGVADITSLSVTDLSKISTLSQSFDGLAGVMLTATNSVEGCAHLQRSLEFAHIYGANSPEEGYSNLIDLGNLATIVQEDTGTTSDILGQSLAEAVIYKVNGKYHDGASGLSVFYPLDNNPESVMKYSELDTSENYKQYLKNIVVTNAPYEDFTNSGAWQGYSGELENMWADTRINEDDYYELKLSGSPVIIKTVKVNRFVFDKASGKNLRLDLDEKCDAQWETATFTYNASTVPALNGHPVTARYIGWGGNYRIYSIPVIVNGEQTNLRVAYSESADKYDVLGCWKGIDANTGKADRISGKIEAFTKITPVMQAYDGTYNLAKSFLTGFGGAKVKSKKLDSGTYFLEYNIEDIYGNPIANNGATLEINGVMRKIYQ